VSGGTIVPVTPLQEALLAIGAVFEYAWVAMDAEQKECFLDLLARKIAAEYGKRLDWPEAA
jgi:hypothetical protein